MRESPALWLTSVPVVRCGVCSAVSQTPTLMVREFVYGSAAADGAVGVGEDGYRQGRVAIRIPEGWGSPDGCCVDDEDNLWIASWGGGRVGRWSPQTGSLLFEFRVADGLLSRVSSVAFGGPTLSDLFITTAAPEEPFDYNKEPLAGSVFVARNLQARGREQVPLVDLATHQP